MAWAHEYICHKERAYLYGYKDTKKIPHLQESDEKNVFFLLLRHFCRGDFLSKRKKEPSMMLISREWMPLVRSYLALWSHYLQ